MERSLKIVPLLISIPRDSGSKDYEAKQRDDREAMHEVISVAENFYANITTLYDKYKIVSNFMVGAPHITLEIVAKEHEIFFYIAVPYPYLDMVEKAISSQYPDSYIERAAEHNIFNKDWGIDKVYGGEIRSTNSFYYPIRTYQELDSEPLESITNAMSKLEKDEGACLQILFRPVSPSITKKVSNISRKMQYGKKTNFIDEILNATLYKTSQEVAAKEKPELTPMEEEGVKAIEKWASKHIFEAQIRVIASSSSSSRSKEIVTNIYSTFHQFTNQSFNGFTFVPARNIEELATDYIFRFFVHRIVSWNTQFRFFRGANVCLNTEELASIYHLPNFLVRTPGIRWLASKKSEPPTFISPDGVIIGRSNFRGEEKVIRISENDRRRHVYILGQTGTGKTTSMINMILSDIKEGKGVCYIDPHGQDLVEHILPYIPKERADDVIVFAAADTERPIGINLFTAKTQEQKDYVIQELIGMFYRLYDPGHQGIVGPRFEHWFRNAALTLMAGPTPGTFIEVPRIFTDDEFLADKLQYVTDPVVRSFFLKEMAETSDYHKSEMLGWFVGKWSAFMTNMTMRNIIGQTESAFDIRQIMDDQKILLINLAKGQVGEENMKLLGMMLIAKIQMSAMSRVDMPEDQRKDFYLYVDEFQNFATDSFSSILSEARKFRLCLTVGNQFIGQLTDDIKEAVFGNVGSLMCFRIGNDDAEYMAHQFEPVFNEQDLINLENYNSVTKILANSTPTRPFSMQGYNYPPGASKEIGDAIIQLSRLKYGRPRDIVDIEIQERMSIRESGGK